MVEVLSSIRGLWPVLRHVPAILLRWYFSQERMAGLIYVDMQPRHESVRVDLGDYATMNAYLQIINLSPFEIEVDRASFQVICGGAVLEAAILKKQKLASGQIGLLIFTSTISDGAARLVARHSDNLYARAVGHLELNSSVRSFSRTIGGLDGVNVTLVNVAGRIANLNAHQS